jgi:hypothetical protein
MLLYILLLFNNDDDNNSEYIIIMVGICGGKDLYDGYFGRKGIEEDFNLYRSKCSIIIYFVEWRAYAVA